MAKNLNAPEHCIAWLRACMKDEWSRERLECPKSPSALGALTGQDKIALGAIAHCWALYCRGDDEAQCGALAAVRALLPALQRQCWPFARELIAQQMDWHNREQVWALVVRPEQLRAVPA